VETEVVDGGQPVAIDYRLHDIDGDWKVYDVVIVNVSMIKNLQAQFDRITARTSVKELLQRIKQSNS
jgi:phospholipid transport system substrate-binding protein